MCAHHNNCVYVCARHGYRTGYCGTRCKISAEDCRAAFHAPERKPPWRDKDEKEIRFAVRDGFVPDAVRAAEKDLSGTSCKPSTSEEWSNYMQQWRKV